VLLFKRILNFKRDFLAKLRDKRRSSRFAVGPRFPLEARVNLTGSNLEGSKPGSGYDWGGKLFNISASGVGLQLLRAAATVRGERTELRLDLEDFRLVIPCVVAHYRTYPNYSVCGLELDFPDFDVQKAFLQLVEAVSTGATLAPVASRPTGGGRSGLVREQYRAANRACLSAWRDPKTRELDSFELVMEHHSIRGSAADGSLEVRRSGKSDRVEAARDVDGEIRRLFRWIVPNAPKAVPADLRALMERCAASTGRPARDTGSRSSSPTQWQAPASRH